MSRAMEAMSPMNDMPDSIQETSGDHHATEAQPFGVAAIRLHYRRRVDWHKAEKALTLQIKAICRRLCDGDKDEANKLYKAMTAGDHESGETQITSVPQVIALAACEPLIVARSVIELKRKDEEKTLKKLAKQLPVWEWAKDVRGCAELSLAQIIGETGDLSGYDNPSKVWKRLGLAPYNGRAASTWRTCGGATADDWVEMGYSPARRSVVYNIGECFVKAGGPYRELYDQFKEEYAAREWCGRCHNKGDKGDREHCTKAHVHNRAKRKAEKRFIRDLWAAWRKC